MGDSILHPLGLGVGSRLCDVWHLGNPEEVFSVNK